MWQGNLNGFVPDQNDPFVEIRQTVSATQSRGKIGTYCILGDTQLESLQRIEEAKEFAKTVKADNTEIPVHLWNDRVKAPGISKEKQDDALTGFPKLGLCLFLQVLVKDSAAHMKLTHGPDWMGKPRQRWDGVLIELGRDQLAIANLLWHLTHTSWFEFNTGSRLIRMRSPLQFWRMTRDNVPAWFTKPGPTTKGKQPKTEGETREKIGKVFKRRYLLLMGLATKLFIKYCVILKGEDDIRLVYEATANKLN